MDPLTLLVRTKMRIGLWSFCSVVALAFQAILDDLGPFFGNYKFSHLLKISPIVCLYEIVWKLVDITLYATSQEIRNVDEKSLPQVSATSYGIIKALLDLINIKMAVEIFSCPAIPWTHIFTTCFLAHIYIARIHRWYVPAPDSDDFLERERRHHITKTIFLPAAHVIVCVLTLKLLGSRSHIIPAIFGFIFMGFLGYIMKELSDSFLNFFSIVLYSYMAMVTFMLNDDPIQKGLDPIGGLIAWDTTSFLAVVISSGREAPNRFNVGVFLIMGLLVPFIAYGFQWGSTPSPCCLCCGTASPL